MIHLLSVKRPASRPTLVSSNPTKYPAKPLYQQNMRNFKNTRFRPTIRQWSHLASGLFPRYHLHKTKVADSIPRRRAEFPSWAFLRNAPLVHSRGFVGNAMSDIHPIILCPLIFSGLLCSLWAYKVCSLPQSIRPVGNLVVHSVL